MRIYVREDLMLEGVSRRLGSDRPVSYRRRKGGNVLLATGCGRRERHPFSRLCKYHTQYLDCRNDYPLHFLRVWGARDPFFNFSILRGVTVFDGSPGATR